MDYQWERNGSAPALINTQNIAPESPDKSIPVKDSSPVQYILDTQKFRTLQDLLKLRVAIDVAENIKTYDRWLLHDIFRDVILDPNLTSNWESRKMKTKERPFKICKVGDDKMKDQTELTDVLQSAPWFFDFIDAVLDSKLWGFSLIEFGPLLPTGMFLPYQVNGKLYPAINCIDRDNVKPELGIITQVSGDITGVSMSDPRYADYLMFVGQYRGFGLLHKLAKYILFKDNCLGNWSEWAEVFGMDMRIGKTATQGNQRTEFIRALRDLGANSYGVFQPQDEVEFTGTRKTDAYKVYHEMVVYIDEQVSKITNGQDVVNNNTGKVVGTVGENIANMYGLADSKYFASIVNQRLFPLMGNLGCTLFDGYRFVWDLSEKLPLAERAKIDKLIADMGFDHAEEYINSTYGTEVSKKPPEPKPLGGPSA